MNKSVLLMGVVFVISLTSLNAQKFFTREGKIAFFSDTPLEKIEAHNNSATSVIDLETGRMEFAVLIKAFQFEKALMQEHFNENYMESDKFPKAVFKGQITNMDEIDLTKEGEYAVMVEGDLTIHGVTQPVQTEGTIKVEEGQMKANSSFTVLVADYEIEIPGVVRDNIAKAVRIDVEMDYKPFEKG